MYLEKKPHIIMFEENSQHLKINLITNLLLKESLSQMINYDYE